jgi:hypothetical protein
MTTLELIESIKIASCSTLPTYKARIARMAEESQLPESLSKLFSESIAHREGQLYLAGIFNEEIKTTVNGTPVLRRIEEARTNGALSEFDHLALIHQWKLRAAEVMR